MVADWLIHQLAKMITRRVERGSFVGAVGGTIIGAIAAGVGAYAAARSHALSREMVFGVTFASSIGGALVGLMLGAAIGPRNRRPDAGRSERRAIRFTFYNTALTPLGFMIIPLLLIGIPTAVRGEVPLPNTPEDTRAAWGLLIAVCIGELVGLWLVMTNVTWIELRDGEVAIGRLAGARTYRLDELGWWEYRADGTERVFRFRIGDRKKQYRCDAVGEDAIACDEWAERNLIDETDPGTAVPGL